MAQARQILNDAEDDLREWRPELYDRDEDAVMAQTNNYYNNNTAAVAAGPSSSPAAHTMSGGRGSGSPYQKENQSPGNVAGDHGTDAGDGKKLRPRGKVGVRN